MINKVLILIFISLFSVVTFAGPMIEISSEEELNHYIKNGSFNGVVLVAKNEKILLKEAFGYKNLDSKIPLTTADKFQIGSLTKQFVAASFLKLQEEGRVSLDDSITKYLPGYSQYKNIKIRDILNHTSGISNYTDHEEFWGMLDYNKSLTLDDLIAFSAKFPLEFETKTKWNYSNSGYILAGKILEMITGDSWDKYINTHFLNPLGMKNSGYQEYFEKISDVSGHIISEDKSVAFTKYNMSWALSAGGMYSNVDDLLKWTSLYENSNLLSETSKKEMQTPFLGDYGLGVWIRPYGDQLMINHYGRTLGFVSNIFYLKNSKLKVITLDNNDGALGDISSLLLSFFNNGKALAIKMDAYPLPVEALEEFVGVYAFGKSELKIYREKNKLFLQTNDGQPPYQMKPNDKDSFNLDGISGEEFLRNGEGKIIGLNHYQNGHVINFIKKNLVK